MLDSVEETAAMAVIVVPRMVILVEMWPLGQEPSIQWGAVPVLAAISPPQHLPFGPWLAFEYFPSPSIVCVLVWNRPRGVWMLKKAAQSWPASPLEVIPCSE